MILTISSTVTFLLLFSFLAVLGYMFTKVLKYQEKKDRIKPTIIDKNKDEIKKINTVIFEVERNSLLNSFIGKEIKEIYYLLVNNSEYEFNIIDSVDLGVGIKFKDDTWLNWIWLESSNDYFTGYYIDNLSLDSSVFYEKYNLLTINHIKENVTNTSKWQKVMNLKIDDVILYKEQGYNRHIGLEIKFNGKSIYFCSSEEPSSENIDKYIKLPISNDWSIIVFETETIKKNKRANYSINLNISKKG